MVFKRCIDNVTRARAFYLSRVKGLSVRKVAGFCGISTASVIRISKGNCPYENSAYFKTIFFLFYILFYTYLKTILSLFLLVNLSYFNTILSLF